MNITLTNIGVFQYTQYELADLTIICGCNNTGKTYATYALYGFLDYFKSAYSIGIDNSYVEDLLKNGEIRLKLDYSQKAVNKHLYNACKIFNTLLPKIFAANEKYFTKSEFLITLNENEIRLQSHFEKTFRMNEKELCRIYKEDDQLLVSIISDQADTDYRLDSHLIRRVIGESIKELIFDEIFPTCFIASAERTGAVIFKDELNFEKNALYRVASSSNDVNLQDILRELYNSGYALPVKRNIDFIRRLEQISKSESKLSKEFPEIIRFLDTMIGGEYKSTKDGLFYTPRNAKSVKLTIGESASSVRALLDISFFLKYDASPGDMLIIDEPELNLHPNNQRNLARLFAMLLNAGIKVFITTHSDYIIRELNTLLMMHARKNDTRISDLMQQYGYAESELIAAEKARMYISTKSPILLPNHQKKKRLQTLVRVPVSKEFGFEDMNFNETIRLMQTMQHEIIYG